MPFLKHHQSLGNFMDVFVRDPRRYMPIMEFLDQIVLHLEELSWSEAEIIATEVSKACHAEFCVGIHAGVTRALSSPENRSETERLEPILVFARKLSLDESSVTENDIESLRNVGWSDQTIEDVIGLVAAIKIYTILDNGFGFGGVPEEAFTEMGRATVGYQGYVATFRSFTEETDQRT